MKIRYFAGTDTLYIEFRDVPVAETRDLDENTLLEVDAKGAADDGILIQKAGKTVYLTTDVPPKYLKRIEVDLAEFPIEKPKLKEEHDDKEVSAPPED